MSTIQFEVAVSSSSVFQVRSTWTLLSLFCSRGSEAVNSAPHSARSSNRARQWQLIRAELPSNGYPQPSGSSKMPASGISSELSSHQMAPAGAIAHSRHHLCPRASSPSSRHSGPKAWGYWVVATLGLLSFSTTLRTQVRPAIEFVSGKEGLRPRIAVFVSRYFCFRVLVFLEFVYWLFLRFARPLASLEAEGR